MFDYVRVNLDQLPIIYPEKESLKNACWQTKDMSCIMTDIYITDEGNLEWDDFEYADVPKNDSSLSQ